MVVDACAADSVPELRFAQRYVRIGIGKGACPPPCRASTCAGQQRQRGATILDCRPRPWMPFGRVRAGNWASSTEKSPADHQGDEETREEPLFRGYLYDARRMMHLLLFVRATYAYSRWRRQGRVFAGPSLQKVTAPLLPQRHAAFPGHPLIRPRGPGKQAKVLVPPLRPPVPQTTVLTQRPCWSRTPSCR